MKWDPKRAKVLIGSTFICCVSLIELGVFFTYREATRRKTEAKLEKSVKHNTHIATESSQLPDFDESSDATAIPSEDGDPRIVTILGNKDLDYPEMVERFLDLLTSLEETEQEELSII